jgi:hypothetical protein
MTSELGIPHAVAFQDEATKHYKLMIAHFCNSFLRIIPIYTNSECIKFVTDNLKISHGPYVCNC